jgi:hypothetical protein
LQPSRSAPAVESAGGAIEFPPLDIEQVTATAGKFEI